MLTTLLIAVAVLIGGVLVYAASRPDTLRVVRSADIKAPPEPIFALINDYRHWATWSPYEKKDPDMKRTFKGAASGKGAIYEFEGDKNAGAGRLEIVETSAPTRAAITLDMYRPCTGHNLIEFTLRPTGSSTNVTWTMQGHSPFMAKLFGIFFNFDKMIGADFESGLAAMKNAAENGLATAA